jgi:hypothetical protein
MKRLPVCFGDFLPHDRSCNGHGTETACLVRDRCSAFQHHLDDTRGQREVLLRVTPRFTYAQPDLIAALDLKVGRLGIRDGLISRAKGRILARRIVPTGPSAEDLVQLFVDELSQASRRKVKPRLGAADVGEIFCISKWRACVRCVYVRVHSTDQHLICEIKPKRAYSLVDITVPMLNFELLFSKKERAGLTFTSSESTTTLLDMDRYRCSIAAHRLAAAINGGPLDKPRTP